jgi:hypothetical protein
VTSCDWEENSLLLEPVAGCVGGRDPGAGKAGSRSPNVVQ